MQGEELQMIRKAVVGQAAAVLLVAVPCFRAEARVVRFVVEQTRTFAEGTSFGIVGQYQRLDGTASFEVDPFDPLNSQIVHIGEAPRNGRGMVEFTSPFFILKPADMTRGNGKIFYVINNRGNKQEWVISIMLPRAMIQSPPPMPGTATSCDWDTRLWMPAGRGTWHPGMPACFQTSRWRGTRTAGRSAPTFASSTRIERFQRPERSACRSRAIPTSCPMKRTTRSRVTTL